MENAESFLHAIKEAPRILPLTTDEWRGGLLWECSLYWVYKLKWGGKRYSIPLKNKRLIKTVEPHGTTIFRILNLCEQCHPFQGYGYSSGLKWFYDVIHSDLIPQSYLHIRPKTDRVSDGRDEIKKLRKRENPFVEGDELHLWRVVEQSTRQAKSQLFEQHYWQPFIKSYSAWLTSIQSPNWKSVTVDGDAIRYRPDRGNGTLKIDLCKKSNLKPLPGKGSRL